MDIYSVLQVVAGLAFFLYGMSVMSSSLEKMAGGSLELTLKKVTSNKLLSFLLGVLITAGDAMTVLQRQGLATGGNRQADRPQQQKRSKGGEPKGESPAGRAGLKHCTFLLKTAVRKTPLRAGKTTEYSLLYNVLGKRARIKMGNGIK